MSVIAWFRNDKGKWHRGSYHSACGIAVDHRVAQTDLADPMDKPISEQCFDCALRPFVDTLERIDAEMAELAEERREAVSRIADVETAFSR